MSSPTRPSVVVFDLGGVLIDWDPRHLYRQLFDDPDEMEAFLDEVALAEWNVQQDTGRPWWPGVERLAGEHPERRELILAFHERWPETLAGEVPGAVAILAELREAGVRLLALSNWSAETFPVARRRFAFLSWFEGILISGEVGVVKPHPHIFERLVERFGVEPAETLFIDDVAANVEAAARLGFRTIRFVGAGPLRAELVRQGLLAPSASAGPDRRDPARPAPAQPRERP